MIYRSLFIANLFLLFNSCIIDAVECQLSWNETPSIKVGMNLTDTCSAGIKVNLKDINIPAFYYLYKQYQHFTHEDKISLLKNPHLFIDAQTALYIINKNEHLKFKAQIIKENNEPAYLSLGSSQYIKGKKDNKNFNIKQHLFFHQNNSPEFDIILSYNKKSSDQFGLQFQGLIKNNEAPYFTITCFGPIYKTIGIKEDILFKNNAIIPTMPKLYNSAKSNPIAPALNTGIYCLALIGQKELEFQFQDKEKIAAYAQQIKENLDELKNSLNAKIHELKKDLS